MTDLGIDLAAADASDGTGLPVELRGVAIAPLAFAPISAIAPFRGREADVAAMLGATLEVGTAVALGDARLVWAGFGQWFLIGAPAPDLGGAAAITEQGDGWAGLRLTGPATRDVLARLVPIDLDPAAFPPGRAARSLLGHVPALMVAIEGGCELFVPRSYAGTAAEEISHAARAVAARAALA